MEQVEVKCGKLTISNNNPFTLIAGPCQLENENHAIDVAKKLKEITDKLSIGLIYKTSFDKANRTSLKGKRGAGLEKSLPVFDKIRKDLGIPVLTDIHNVEQCALVSKHVDVLQIPAFLCRQTDLLIAAAKTGKVINVKKGQFISPDEMKHVVHKLGESGCEDVMLTERGTFFGYNRLVNDFIGLGDLMEIGPPVFFDVTHSTQLPGGGTNQTAGRPDRAALLARAATAAGVPALFLECHPDPINAASDASTMQRLDDMEEIIRSCASISQIASNTVMP